MSSCFSFQSAFSTLIRFNVSYFLYNVQFYIYTLCLIMSDIVTSIPTHV